MTGIRKHSYEEHILCYSAYLSGCSYIKGIRITHSM